MIMRQKEDDDDAVDDVVVGATGGGGSDTFGAVIFFFFVGSFWSCRGVAAGGAPAGGGSRTTALLDVGGRKSGSTRRCGGAATTTPLFLSLLLSDRRMVGQVYMMIDRSIVCEQTAPRSSSKVGSSSDLGGRELFVCGAVFGFSILAGWEQTRICPVFFSRADDSHALAIMDICRLRRSVVFMASAQE
jgi:hypothetical protein